MKKSRIIIALLLVLAVLAGCSTEKEYFEDYNDGTWAGYFKAWWHAMSDNYVLWDKDSPSGEWDKVYNDYLPQFEALGKIKNTPGNTPGAIAATDQEALHLFYEIIDNNISDRHYMFRINCIYYPAYNQTSDQLYYSYPVISRLNMINAEDETEYWTLIDGTVTADSTYAKSEFYQFSDITKVWEKDFGFTAGAISQAAAMSNLVEITETNFPVSDTAPYKLTGYHGYYYKDPSPNSSSSIYLLYGYIEDASTSTKSLYLSFDSYYLVGSIAGTGEGGVPYNVITEFFNILLTSDPAPDLIIDLRCNGGGDTTDLSFLLGQFVAEDTQFASIYTKSGSNRLSYTPKVPYSISASPDTTQNFGGGIRVLVSSHTVSCAEMTTMFFKALKEYHSDDGWDISIIGTNTAGGTCALMDYQVLNAGWMNTNSFYIYTATYQTVYLDGKSYEKVGITPDDPVTYDYNTWTTGTGDDWLKAVLGY